MYAKNEMNPLHNGVGFESKKLKDQRTDIFPGSTNCIAKGMQEGTGTKTLKDLALERRRLLDVLRSINRK